MRWELEQSGDQSSWKDQTMRVASALVGAAAGIALHIAQPNAGSAQTRAECEEGIRFIRNELSRAASADQRAILTKALRDAERELGEEEYDECLDAVDDAKSAASGQPPAPARVRGPAEVLQADPGLPVSVEDAFVPRPGEVEAKSRFVYDRVRRKISGNEDEGTLRRSGRNRYTPGVELEVGIVPGLAATMAAEYRLGDADDAKSGEVEFGGTWNFLSAHDWRPALALSAGVSLPYGYRNDSAESSVALLASMPLGDVAEAPYLHANFIWTHSFKIEEEERTDRFAGILGLAVPLVSTTALILDVVREQESERRRVSNLVELGIRQALPGKLTLAGGVGVGVGNTDTDFRVLIGLQKSF
jgi:hypothetical protein